MFLCWIFRVDCQNAKRTFVVSSWKLLLFPSEFSPPMCILKQGRFLAEPSLLLSTTMASSTHLKIAAKHDIESASRQMGKAGEAAHCLGGGAAVPGGADCLGCRRADAEERSCSESPVTMSTGAGAAAAWHALTCAVDAGCTADPWPSIYFILHTRMVQRRSIARRHAAPQKEG